MSELIQNIKESERPLWIPGTIRGMKLIFIDKSRPPLTAIVDSIDQLAIVASKAEEHSDVHMVTCSVNTISPSSKIASRERGKWLGGASFKGADIDRIRSLFVDFDGGGEMACSLGAEFVKYICERYELPRPFTANSGRGFHARWLLDAEATKENEGIVRATLKAFADLFALRYPGAAVKIDTSTHDLPRVCKVYGTSKKSAEGQGPRSQMIDCGDGVVMPIDILQVLVSCMAKELPQTSPKESKPARRRARSANKIEMRDVEKWLCEVHGISVVRSTTQPNGTIKHELSGCLYGEHKTNSAVIFELPDGGLSYNCLDSECADHNGTSFLRDVEQWLAAKRIEGNINAMREAHGLPVVELGNRQLRDIVDDILAGVAETNEREAAPVIYAHNGRLSRLVSDDHGRIFVEALTEKSCPGVLSRIMDFYRVTNNGDVKACALSQEYVNAILSAGKWEGIPTLRGITRVPILSDDGALRTSRGYDKTTGLYYDAVDMIEVASQPTKEDAYQAARALCDGPLAEFPFYSPADRANALALMLTAVLKDNVGLLPIGIADANQRGCGKTTLVKMLGVLIKGTAEVPTSTAPRDDDEWRKQITTWLSGGAEFVVIDNVDKGDCLRSDALAAAVTSTSFNARRLGSNDSTANMTFKNNIFFTATGNNIKVNEDFERRVCVVRLVHKDPLSRSFTHTEIPDWVCEHRSEIISHLFTMVRACMLSGAAEWSEKPIQTFVKWSKTIGGILDFCGFVDDDGRSLFMSNRKRVSATMSDGDGEQLKAFYAALHDEFADDPFTVKDVFDKCREAGSQLVSSLPSIRRLKDISDGGFTRSLGKLFREERDRPYGSFRLTDLVDHSGVPKEDRDGRLLWRIEKI